MTRPAKGTLETILVVEDNPLLLRLVCSILEEAGFCVLAASNSKIAIQMESSFRGTIHMLLSDVVMPDMSGPDITKRLKKNRPDMRVILMSGYPNGQLLFLNHGWHFIQKPFVAAALAAKVNEVLHTPESSQGDDKYDTRVQGASGKREVGR